MAAAITFELRECGTGGGRHRQQHLDEAIPGDVERREGAELPAARQRAGAVNNLCHGAPQLEQLTARRLVHRLHACSWRRLI